MDRFRQCDDYGVHKALETKRPVVTDLEGKISKYNKTLKERYLLAEESLENHLTELFLAQDRGKIKLQKRKPSQTFFAFSQIFTGKVKKPGTGLGLVISKKIIEKHGGRIWIESEYGKGSKFCFSLPIL